MAKSKNEEMVDRVMADPRFRGKMPRSVIEFIVQFNDANPEFHKELAKKERRRKKPVTPPISAQHGQTIVTFPPCQDVVTIEGGIVIGDAPPTDPSIEISAIDINKEEDVEETPVCKLDEPVPEHGTSGQPPEDRSECPNDFIVD